MSSDSSSQQPSLIGGHAQYVKGAAESSAETDKNAGIEAMKSASANRDPAKDGYGKVEELAGRVAGCEGMEKEGAVSKET
ncbi:hypothetical protein B0A48_08164 [Cryoendolithus antarcticus]|uniref:Uncharacterized protein n=1 Tax=Cryoendolithus antarcticus TaxID=1507870 RepID=A0A1V8T1E8_9PEZI|nr:hypothetical protein B0A48_08164 [Cryoendolithus antarcticus]